jgi:hypothetical protein
MYFATGSQISPYIILSFSPFEYHKPSTKNVFGRYKLGAGTLSWSAVVQQVRSHDVPLHVQKLIGRSLEQDFGHLLLNGKSVKVGHVDIVSGKSCQDIPPVG